MPVPGPCFQDLPTLTYSNLCFGYLWPACAWFCACIQAYKAMIPLSQPSLLAGPSLHMLQVVRLGTRAVLDCRTRLSGDHPQVHLAQAPLTMTHQTQVCFFHRPYVSRIVCTQAGDFSGIVCTQAGCAKCADQLLHTVTVKQTCITDVLTLCP